jgi:predicted nucleotidyltransferase
MSESFGLKPGDLDKIISVVQREQKIEKALLFGTRVKGSYKRGSDVDIVLQGCEVTDSIAAHIGSLLNEETLMPYKFDVLNYNSIVSSDLLDHIKRVGIVFYSKAPTKGNKI